MARKLSAGPTPDGTFVTRRTDNNYSHAVITVSTCERVYKPRDPEAINDYVPNPDFGKWVSLSWHTRYDLAAKKAEQWRGHGYKAAVVPVVDPKEGV